MLSITKCDQIAPVFHQYPCSFSLVTPIDQRIDHLFHRNTFRLYVAELHGTEVLTRRDMAETAGLHVGQDQLLEPNARIIGRLRINWVIEGAARGRFEPLSAQEAGFGLAFDAQPVEGLVGRFSHRWLGL